MKRPGRDIVISLYHWGLVNADIEVERFRGRCIPQRLKALFSWPGTARLKPRPFKAGLVTRIRQFWNRSAETPAEQSRTDCQGA